MYWIFKFIFILDFFSELVSLILLQLLLASYSKGFCLCGKMHWFSKQPIFKAFWFFRLTWGYYWPENAAFYICMTFQLMALLSGNVFQPQSFSVYLLIKLRWWLVASRLFLPWAVVQSLTGSSLDLAVL